MSEDCLLTGALEPTNEAYAIAKIAGLKLCQYYRRQHGVLFHSVDADEPLRAGRQLPSEELPRAAGAHPALPRGEGGRAPPRSRRGARARRGGSSSTWTTWPTPARSSSGARPPGLDQRRDGNGRHDPGADGDRGARRPGTGAGWRGTRRSPTAPRASSWTSRGCRPWAGRPGSGCREGIAATYRELPRREAVRHPARVAHPSRGRGHSSDSGRGRGHGPEEVVLGPPERPEGRAHPVRDRDRRSPSSSACSCPRGSCASSMYPMQRMHMFEKPRPTVTLQIGDAKLGPFEVDTRAVPRAAPGRRPERRPPGGRGADGKGAGRDPDDGARRQGRGRLPRSGCTTSAPPRASWWPSTSRSTPRWPSPRPFWIFFMGGFILPALNLKERSVIFSWLGWSGFLFFAGVLSTYFVLLPVALRASIQYSEVLGFSAQDWRADEYINFVCKFIFGMGLGFQFPLIVLFLVKIGVLTHAHLDQVPAPRRGPLADPGRGPDDPGGGDPGRDGDPALPALRGLHLDRLVLGAQEAQGRGPPRPEPAPPAAGTRRLLTPFEHALLLLLLIAGLSVVGRWLPWPQLITYLFGGRRRRIPAGLSRGSTSTRASSSSASCRRSSSPTAGSCRCASSSAPSARSCSSRSAWSRSPRWPSGLVAHWLVPGLPLAMAFALGAIVSPTDAVSVNAVTERLQGARAPHHHPERREPDERRHGPRRVQVRPRRRRRRRLLARRRMALEFSLLSVGGFAVGLGVGYGDRPPARPPAAPAFERHVRSRSRSR